MVIVDDHLALLASAGQVLQLGLPGPVATTTGFQFRLARAVADSARSGSLSRTVTDPLAALQRILAPPGHRLVILDPRISMGTAVEIAVRHQANLLLSELAGAALAHHAAVRVTPANVGRSWAEVMRTHDIDFETVEP